MTPLPPYLLKTDGVTDASRFKLITISIVDAVRDACRMPRPSRGTGPWYLSSRPSSRLQATSLLDHGTKTPPESLAGRGVVVPEDVAWRRDDGLELRYQGLVPRDGRGMRQASRTASTMEIVSNLNLEAAVTPSLILC